MLSAAYSGHYAAREVDMLKDLKKDNLTELSVLLLVVA
jgi:hypothetical protein